MNCVPTEHRPTDFNKTSEVFAGTSESVQQILAQVTPTVVIDDENSLPLIFWGWLSNMLEHYPNNCTCVTSPFFRDRLVTYSRNPDHEQQMSTTTMQIPWNYRRLDKGTLRCPLASSCIGSEVYVAPSDNGMMLHLTSRADYSLDIQLRGAWLTTASSAVTKSFPRIYSPPRPSRHGATCRARKRR